MANVGFQRCRDKSNLRVWALKPKQTNKKSNCHPHIVHIPQISSPFQCCLWSAKYQFMSFWPMVERLKYLNVCIQPVPIHSSSEIAVLSKPSALHQDTQGTHWRTGRDTTLARLLVLLKGILSPTVSNGIEYLVHLDMMKKGHGKALVCDENGLVWFKCIPWLKQNSIFNFSGTKSQFIMFYSRQCCYF